MLLVLAKEPGEGWCEGGRCDCGMYVIKGCNALHPGTGVLIQGRQPQQQALVQRGCVNASRNAAASTPPTDRQPLSRLHGA